MYKLHLKVLKNERHLNGNVK